MHYSFNKKLKETIEYFKKYETITVYDPTSTSSGQVKITYESGVEVDSKKVHKEWIAKMKDLNDKTYLLNKKLNTEKQIILKYHKDSIIIS